MGPIQSRWTPSPYDVIKLNVDATWYKSKASLAILATNYDAKVLDLRYDNYEFALALVEMLAIE